MMDWMRVYVVALIGLLGGSYVEIVESLFAKGRTYCERQPFEVE